MPYKSHKCFCVYRVRHIPTDRTIYVGKTNSPKRRWNNHCTSKKERLLQDYMRHHGGLAEYELVPLVWASSEASAFSFERDLIRHYLLQGPLLNRDLGGVGGWDTGGSETHKRQWARLTPEQRKARMQPLHDAARGKAFSSDRRAAISKALLRFHAEHPEAALRTGARRQGQRHTKEARRQMGAFRCKLSAEQVQLVRQLHTEGQSMKRLAEQFEVRIKSIFNAIHGVGAYGD